MRRLRRCSPASPPLTVLTVEPGRAGVFEDMFGSDDESTTGVAAVLSFGGDE